MLLVLDEDLLPRSLHYQRFTSDNGKHKAKLNQGTKNSQWIILRFPVLSGKVIMLFLASLSVRTLCVALN